MMMMMVMVVVVVVVRMRRASDLPANNGHRSNPGLGVVPAEEQ